MLSRFPPRLFFAWFSSALIAVPALGFLKNFYPTFFEITLLSLAVQTILGLLMSLLLAKAKKWFRLHPLDLALALGLVLALTAFAWNLFTMARRFPRLFAAEEFILQNGQALPFGVGSFLALLCLAWVSKIAQQENIKNARAYRFVDQNAVGILIAILFFGVYLILVSIFNQPAFDVDDIFFDSDGLLWRTRFTTEAYRDYYWRSVHPFVLLMIRPLVMLFALFLKGNSLSAAFVLIAFAGALCVFLTWYFVKQTVGGSVYPLLIAALLGASAAHLVFGSLIETYIFLAAAALLFMVLLLKDQPFLVLVMTGLFSFGVTITNFAHTVIAFWTVRRDIKQWLRYGFTVGVLVVPLALLNNFLYPNSQPYFFIPSNLTTEADNTFTPTLARGAAILRVMFLQSMVAPDPLILDEEIPFLKVWIFKAEPMRLSSYATLSGSVLAFFWLALIVLGVFLFFKNLKKQDRRFPFAFVLILLFNFALHLRYGKDLFLYSTNWVYAMVLFLALAWRQISNQRWFQIVLLVFLALLLANNSRLIFTMLSTSALHIK